MTKSNRIYQVAVVGAGTAGLLAADVISSAGISVVVIEKTQSR